MKNFDWDINSNPVQRLYLSENTLYMMEVTNDFIANVYYRVNVTEDLTTIRDADDFGSPTDLEGTNKNLLDQNKKEGLISQKAKMMDKERQM